MQSIIIRNRQHARRAIRPTGVNPDYSSIFQAQASAQHVASHLHLLPTYGTAEVTTNADGTRVWMLDFDPLG